MSKHPQVYPTECHRSAEVSSANTKTKKAATLSLCPLKKRKKKKWCEIKTVREGEELPGGGGRLTVVGEGRGVAVISVHTMHGLRRPSTSAITRTGNNENCIERLIYIMILWIAGQYMIVTFFDSS